MDKETKRVVKAAKSRGWVLAVGGKHHILIHQESSRKVSFSMSPSCGNAHRQVERDIFRVEKALKQLDS
jgi:hypothetical protein